MEIAVLGTGAVGAFAARRLAAEGVSVTAFEQFTVDHAFGSSYGESRVTRRVYPDALYAGLMNSAYPLWAQLESETGEELFLRCGGFFFGPCDLPEMLEIEQALDAVGHEYQAWSAAESMARLPAFRLTPDEYGIWDADSGLLRASRCVRAGVASAVRRGARVREGACVTALEPGGERVAFRCDGHWETYDRVVITAGAWSGTLLASLGLSLPLQPTRQQYAHFAVTGDAALFGPDRFPVWIDFGSNHYGFPEHDSVPGVKVALHEAGPPQDPGDLDRTPDPLVTKRLRDYMRLRVPDAAGEPTCARVCLYTMTPDTDFVVEQPGEFPQVVLVAGLSGHGFKFSILLGEIAAELALGLPVAHDLKRFRAGRFSLKPT